MKEGSKKDRYTHYPRTILWLVRGGSFTMGGEEADAQPHFEVEVSPFYISKWPITNEQFEAYDPAFERSLVSAGDLDTAVGVSYHEASGYAQWYAEVSRKKMRLPTEQEWEYACRGECQQRFFWGDDKEQGDPYVWDARTSSGFVQPAAKTRPNNFGLHSMLGGVWEWTSSLYRPYPLSDQPWVGQPSSDEAPLGTAATQSGGLEPPRVLRGGSFRSSREVLTCSARKGASPAEVSDEFGFRIVRGFG